MSSILVLGGAGYIGSHTVYELIAAGEQVVVADNLQTGFRAAVHPAARFYQGDIRDRAFLDSIFEQEEIDGVIHFAANSQVGESMINPLKYYNNNLCGTEVLLESMVAHKIDKIVFSSTAATYGSRNGFRFWKRTALCRRTATERPSFPWRKCSTGRHRHIICGMYPCGISMPVEHIRTDRSEKHMSRRRI